MTEPPDARIPTPEEPAAALTERIEDVEADLADETRQMVVDERVNTRAVSDARADVTAIPPGGAARTAGDGSPRAGMRISIAGNVAAEPTFGLTQDGRSWARLRVASHERVRDAAGQWTSTPPSYTEVVLFGRTAEDAANSLQIGDPVMVQGRPEVQAFTRRDGAPGAGLKVFATTVTRRDTQPTTLGQGPATRADRPADRGVGE